VQTQTCPQCQEENAMHARACVCCGHVFESEIKIFVLNTCIRSPASHQPQWRTIS
jgi:hypothetical protein